MNNSQSDTESTNNLNLQNSPCYCKQKPRTVTFAADTSKFENNCVPNLLNKGNDANNETILRRGKGTITVVWKPRTLKCNAVIKYTNGRIEYTGINIRGRCNKGLQDKTNQILSLNMVPVREIDA